VQANPVVDDDWGPSAASDHGSSTASNDDWD
jgi:hypothetical protein